MSTVLNIRANKVGVYIAVITLLTYPVSTCTAGYNFSSMKRLKTPLQSTISDGRVSSLAILHIHKTRKMQFPFRKEKMPTCKDSDTFFSSGTSSFVKTAVGFLLGKKKLLCPSRI